ncbi:hypothetical protein DICVIV_12168 [Dictyocaulus viviparus]|uniref:Protein kinase domain-containing protein n=1 Tax=Dictyocaulus viviparus TaxID=29172 RepID=A0A0D8XB88_DICVI|nr:hypothetical protein DICVIV_12168 [Dictyocaulus viviparus]
MAEVNDPGFAIILSSVNYPTCRETSFQTKKRKPNKKQSGAVDREKMKEGDTVQSDQFIWRIIKLLGSGGFGDVYKVQKLDNPDKTVSVSATMCLTICIVHFVLQFLVMGLVGPSLEDIRKKDLIRNYTKATAMQCCIQTMTALRDLHGIGYLHRDIKPQNYAIGLGPKETTIYMLDFGIARKFTEGDTKKVKLVWNVVSNHCTYVRKM